MLSYFGVLDDAHLRAVARSALRARGFSLAPGAAAAHAADHRRIGTLFMEEFLPLRLSSWVDAAALGQLRAADPVLWERLPLTAALGWRCVDLFLSTSQVIANDDVRALGGAFNAIISVVDYVLDERPDGHKLFDLLDEALLTQIFDLQSDVDRILEAVYRAAGDAHSRLLFALIGVFAAESRRIHHVLGNQPSWNALGDTVARLLRAERSTALGARAEWSVESSLMLANLEYKSVAPSLALMQIAALSDPSIATAEMSEAAMGLGRVLWRIDDLVDLLPDCRRRIPSTLTLRVRDHVLSQGRDVIADADLYDVVDEAAIDVMQFLLECTFDAAPKMLDEFARAYVGGWIGWPEESQSLAPRHVARDVKAAAADAAAVLMDAQRNGFADEAHTLSFPRGDTRYESHAARLCLRAVTLDALLDARDAGLPVDDASLHAEALLLLRAKHRHVRGGWSYIAEVPELPPDTDDNGFVVQVLTRLGGRELAATGEEPIRLLLDAARADGGIPTWVIDPRGDTACDAAVRHYLGVMGGWGVHPEVVANFGYALILFDHARYIGPIDRIASYLESVQDDDGSWTSMWYDGPYYGTFRAATHLASSRPGSRALVRAREFIVARQHDDGGWGNAESDPLSTALALLCLDRFQLAESSAFARGVRRLLREKSPGGWRECPWIRFPVTDGEVVYGSRAATTAFCLKALMVVPDTFAA